MPERFEVLGIPVDSLGIDGVIAKALESARERRFFQIATVNVDFLVNSRKDEEVRTILARSDVNVPDGAPVVWAGRMLGCRGLKRLPGVDLVPPLLRAAALEGLHVFFLGGADNAAAEAAERLRARQPGLKVTVYEPPLAPLEQLPDEEILQAIRSVEPHILLVAFGHPKQDKWIYRHRESLPMVAIGVGGTFDLIAEHHRRAPLWMQSLGLEWSYRLACEPRRLARRYAGDAVWVAARLGPWLLARQIRAYARVAGV